MNPTIHQTNSIPQLNNQLPLGIEDFASMSMEAVYVIDFLKQDFHFVTNHNLFLCGHIALCNHFYICSIQIKAIPLSPSI